MVISWSTESPVDRPSVLVGPAGSVDRRVAAETRQAPGHPVSYHHATVDGLEPGTTYAYVIEGPEPAQGALTTAPGGPAPFRFATFGDMGVTDAGTRITELVAAAAPDVVFVAGDLCYADKSGGLLGALPPEFQGINPAQDLAEWDRWFEQIRPSAASTPWMPTVGNHEMETGQGPLGYDGFFARMPVPRTGPRADSPVYVFRWAGVAFFALDGNDLSAQIRPNQGYTEGAQLSWLRATLAELRADPAVEFIVAGFHNCMYCSNAVHASDGGVRSGYEPFFDEFGVDLVVNGHNHSYERTHPVRDGMPSIEAPVGATVTTSEHGTTYLTAGAGGQAAYPTTLHPLSYVWTQVAPGAPAVQVPESADWSSVRLAGDHSLALVDVTPAAGDQPARMELRAMAAVGTEFDRVVILGRAHPAVPAVPAPAPSVPERAPAGAVPPAPSSATLPETGGPGRSRVLLGAGLAAAAAGGAAVARTSVDPGNQTHPR
jgi:hypothetical protein